MAAVTSVPIEANDMLVLILTGHVGRNHRIRRSDLLRELRSRLNIRLSDRKMRDLIELLREDHPICSTSNGGGYWWAGDPEEFDATIAEFRSRMESFGGTLRSLERMKAKMLAEPLEQGRLI